MKLLEVAFNFPYYDRFLRYRNHAIFSVFLYAGLRKQELLNLRYLDVDLENLVLFIRNGKGGKDRLIPITAKLAESLRLYLIDGISLCHCITHDQLFLQKPLYRALILYSLAVSALKCFVDPAHHVKIQVVGMLIVPLLIS